jgi:hypothetical protein
VSAALIVAGAVLVLVCAFVLGVWAGVHLLSREVVRQFDAQRVPQRAAERQGFEPFDYTERS